MRVVELPEYETVRLPKPALSEKAARWLWREHGTKVAVEYPSPLTGDQWELTSQGWVGYLPVDEGLHLALQPKVPVRSVFAMLEHAYGLRGFQLLEGEAPFETLDDALDRLARILARRTLHRARRGLHRAYVGRRERLPVVRGRLDVGRLARRPWAVDPTCHYEEHTADVDDNGIVAWALHVVARSGVCRPEGLRVVRQAYRRMEGAVAVRPYRAEACIGRTYSRLTEDYAALHALSRLFIENVGLGQGRGNRRLLPFLVDMAALFEGFVAEWLRERLAKTHRVVPHVRYAVGDTNHFDVDLVVYDRAGDPDVPLCVVDTKYKGVRSASTGDIAQVVAYATALGCRDAVLLYPREPEKPLKGHVGGVRVRSLVFDLSRGLDEAGDLAVRGLLDRARQDA